MAVEIVKVTTRDLIADLSLQRLVETEKAIAEAKPAAIAREVARLEQEAATIGLTLEDLLGRKRARLARQGRTA